MPEFTVEGKFISSDLGAKLEHTSVTSAQVELLLEAVRESNELGGPIIEIGSFRGVTTRSLALVAGLHREVVAVDPYLGEGGHEKDFCLFRQHTSNLRNVRHIRAASDQAFRIWNGAPISLVFIDAMHEYLHALYDFEAWGSLVQPGGFVAFHDVDLFSGVNFLCQHILASRPEWRPWAYAPNIAIFERRVVS
ncbi:class I SAM-dependent methyltransferase [Phragmitibacter flavus]|uniref:class I SAM-dependent methyltransferase n=1 Tax=Phragmitibacter flavus TaxID=2576071 RepID=UPI001407E19D|nr:class I SAM-dependent methyltransferase [Phragmitibacter flavus]